MVSTLLYIIVAKLNLTSLIKEDNGDYDMAVVHSFAFGEEPEDLENKSRASCYDDKTASVQANGTPENKVCNDKCCRTNVLSLLFG